jgi:hypothetical protein
MLAREASQSHFYMAIKDLPPSFQDRLTDHLGQVWQNQQ